MPKSPLPDSPIWVDSAHGEREIDVSSRPLPLHTSTRDRLAAWKNAPGGRGEVEGEYEMGGFFQVNMEVCLCLVPGTCRATQADVGRLRRARTSGLGK